MTKAETMTKAERAAMVEARWAAEQAGNVALAADLQATLDADLVALDSAQRATKGFRGGRMARGNLGRGAS